MATDMTELPLADGSFVFWACVVCWGFIIAAFAVKFWGFNILAFIVKKRK